MAPNSSSTSPLSTMTPHLRGSLAPLPKATKGEKSLLQRADEGDVEALNEMGLRLERGEGAPVNLALAAKYFSDAAAKGHADGCYNYGVALFKGRGVCKDAEGALKWFIEAEKQGHAFATFMVAQFVEAGVGCEQDTLKAASLYKRAQALGVEDAAGKLEQCYASAAAK
uniref:Uncharacterized protein n=1 Tax=Palpitomonas bilix TaxID=652834 RepID=A0A7S3GBP6_9EUKA|mmetsp:Transcript_40390/g.104724  ORF Transcript_40390/g.104724 Transcript_40390/m.104724 type:complete len:169 (+) Transcript_40390:310-816(+)|eukprot:CAMPEP_0113879720 /NCGR_PEP_ID=MMETSP0780_2-20120614/7390_1 /TAXON_ID=652834 /ORGANISM="Palpitomonas bilix" /LENGTH=168 /DNA_ID=CAMNT_0000866323 /DNA_START=219 /DNA_END=725 /DNA_ORIENTATION=+ /assembly_acc=CAM_ASM_000599